MQSHNTPTVVLREIDIVSTSFHLTSDRRKIASCIVPFSYCILIYCFSYVLPTSADHRYVMLEEYRIWERELCQNRRTLHCVMDEARVCIIRMLWERFIGTFQQSKVKSIQWTMPKCHINVTSCQNSCISHCLIDPAKLEFRNSGLRTLWHHSAT